MTTPIPLQFAFQGGGAKIAALLAVAEVIQEFERDRKITITSVAGTSAGSIVAAFVAAGISASQVMGQLRAGDGQRLLRECKIPGKPAIVWRLMRGRPIWDSSALRGWLNSQFKKAKVVKVADASARIPLTITKTNLGSRASVPAQESEMIADALIDSCALPYLFRVWNRNGTPTFVDGGISNNLPIAYLPASQPGKGELIAVSFADVSTAHPDSFGSFSLALLDAAISSTMNLIKGAHSRNLLEISTTLGTFDFAKAISNDFEEGYDRIKDWARLALQERVDKIREASRIAIADPWKETNPTAVNLMQLIGQAYSKSLATTRLPYDSCRLIVYSNAGRPENDPYARTPDRALFEFVFRSGAEPTYCISAGLVGQSDETYFAADSARCVVTDARGQRIDFVKVPARTDDEGTRELCLFFTPPLPAKSGPYTVRFVEDGENLMAELFTKGKDVLGYHPQRPDGPVGTVELVLFVHESIKLLLQAQDQNRQGASIDCDAIVGHAPVFPSMKGYGLSLSQVNSPWVVDVHKIS
jgi:NTE family protein